MSAAKRKVPTKGNHRDSGSLLVRWSTGQLLMAGIPLFAVVVVGLCLLKLYQPDTLRFRTIQVFGDLQWMQKDKLDQLILGAMDGGFFSLDVKMLKQILEQQAWIRSVSVRRVWPDVLQVVVNEQKPVAVWNSEQLINVDSEIFHPMAEGVPANMVRVVGPAGSHSVLMRHYLALQEMLIEQGLHISQIQINDRRAMDITLNNGMRLLMGRVRDELESGAELSRFIQAYRLALAPNVDRISVVDLRYTNGLAVRWKSQTASQESESVPATEISNKKIARLVWGYAQG